MTAEGERFALSEWKISKLPELPVFWMRDHTAKQVKAVFDKLHGIPISETMIHEARKMNGVKYKRPPDAERAAPREKNRFTAEQIAVADGLRAWDRNNEIDDVLAEIRA